MSYAETKIETGVPAQFLYDARRLEKKWELADGPRPVAEVLGSGTTGFENLGEFLGKRKSEAITYKIDSLAGPAEIEKILGATTNPDIDFVAAQVNNMSMLQAYDTFLGIYMSPNGAFTDINFRLGKVSKTLLKNKESSQVNSDGSIYTRSNFHKKFNSQVLRAYGGYGGYAYQAQYNTGLYYANMFFPPYASPSEPSKSFLSTYIPAWNRSSRNGTSNGSWTSYSSYLRNSHKWASNENLHFDTSNFTLKRDGAFTYRHAGFKSINDNIMFLQWVLENTTGVVSTYLTEWDMSVYFQEGFIPSKDNQKLSLLYRIEDDNPMKDYPLYNKYAGDADNLNYLTFGVVNAATSLETTNLKWNINKFPMSRYWVKYPMTYFQTVSYGDDYEEQMALVNSPIISETEKAALRVQIALETQTDYIPDFYKRESLNPGMLFSGAPIMDKIEYCDRRGAALSGWWSWNMYYYKSLFVVPGVELSDLDANNMLSDANNVYDVAKANQEQGSSESGTGAGSCYGTSAGGGSKWYKKKKPSSGSAGASKAKAAGNRYVSSAVYAGVQEKVLSDSSNQAGAETFDEAKSLQYSSSTGLSDNNPVFFGGPHGASRSPKNPKSFFEINNVLMRNTPRIDPPESFDSKDLKAYLSGLNQFYSYKARTGSDELAESHRVKGVSENSFVGGLSLLKNGVQEKRWMLSMKRVKRYTNVQSDWWWWGWWWWGRHHRWQDNYPTHVYAHNGNNWGWQRLYYDSAWCWHGWRWGNNISGYDRNGDGWPDYARSNWWWHWGGGNRRAYYWTYEWGWGERYMLHGEPYTQWEMKEITYNQYTVSIPFATLSYWFSIFRRYRAKANAYVRAIGPSRKRIELTGTGYWAMERSFGNWPKQTVRWTSGTTRIMNWFVKNSRELGTPNHLIFMAGENIFRSGGMAYPDAIFQAPVSMKEYSFGYSYNARDRRHKCHRHDCIHQSVGWREYMDVDLFSDDSVPFALMSTSQNAWTNLYSRDVFEDLAPTGNYARCYNDIYQLFNGGTLRGCGIYSSIQGFAPNLEQLEGTNYHALLDGSRYSNTRFCDVRFNYFSINNYAIAPRNTYGGFSYYPIGGVEQYSSNWMPYAQSQALMRGMLTAGLYVATRNEAYLCWGDAPFRVLYAQLANQVQFYRIAKDAVLSETVLPASNIRQMLLRCVDPRVIKVSCRSYSTYDNEDSRYNYWIERAFTHFDKTPSVVSEYMARIRAELDGVIASYTSYLDVLKPLVSKHVMCWTYNEYYQAIMEYLPAIKAGVQGDLMFDEFFYCYLNILYEYRKYFINKRFNKVDGTFYQLRHLEGMLAFMKSSTSTGAMPAVNFSGDTQAATDIPVSFYTINHTPEQKTEALLSGEALKPDEILKLYVPVTYSTEARYLKELAKRKFDPAHRMAVVKTERTDSAKKYAEVPIDGTYQLVSDQYKKNENNKKVNKVITEKYLAQEVDASQIALVTVANPDYSQLIRAIKWGDSQSLTPIEEDIAVNINASVLVDALQVTTDLHEAVCAARERQDFWTVNVSTSNCQARGYKTGLTLVPYAKDPTDGPVSLTIEESAMGINANQLWPISEEQAQITTMASFSAQQKLKEMIGTGLTGEEFFG